MNVIARHAGVYMVFTSSPFENLRHTARSSEVKPPPEVEGMDRSEIEAPQLVLQALSRGRVEVLLGWLKYV